MIRVGLAGYGLAGRVFHAPLIQRCDHMRLSAIWTSQDIPNRAASLDELIERSDLVVIATPNATHFEIAAIAPQAGKHVVVDKPFMVTSDEADAAIALAEKQGVVLTVFQNRRWDSDFLTVRKLLPQLGEIILFESHWDRFRPQIKAGWREVAKPGGGVLNDLGSHLIDQALLLFGTPEAVSAELIAQRPGAVVDDYFDLILHYGAPRICLRSSTLVARARPRFSIHGSNGSFIKHGLDPQEAQLKAGMDPGDRDYGLDERNGTLTTSEGRTEEISTERGCYLSFYEGVAATIREGRPTPVNPVDARNGLMIIDLARKSSQLGKVLPVPGASSTAKPGLQC